MQQQEIKPEHEDRWFPDGYTQTSGKHSIRGTEHLPSPPVVLGNASRGIATDEPSLAPPTYLTCEMACWAGCLCIAIYCLTTFYLGLGELLDRTLAQKAHPSPMSTFRSIHAGNTEISADLPADPINRDGDFAFAALNQGQFQNKKSTPLPEISTLPELDDPTALVSPGSGQAFRDRTATGEFCLDCPEMVIVPSGSFVLGSQASESWRDDWQKAIERPQINIAIAKPIAVGRFAVSFDEWKACVVDAACVAIHNDNGWGQGNRPVINVTWHEAKNYVEWLSRKTGKTYRLLSEAEREYATRAGTTTPFWFGTTPSPKIANYLWDRTLPVNSLTPNPWGLYHVHGNVGEWTEDCWNSNHLRHPQNTIARLDGNCNRRVVKGGSWFNAASHIRSASRSGLDSNAYYRTVGFRVARSLEGVAAN